MRYKNTFITLEQELFSHLEQSICKHNLHYAEDDDNKIMMDKAVFLIDYIRNQKCYRKDHLVNGYIRLHSKFLNAYLGKELKKYKTFLEGYGYIKTTPYDTDKSISIGYRISFYDKKGYKNIVKKEYRVYEFISMTYEEYLSVTIEKQAQIERRKKSADRNTKHLTKWLNGDNIQIDWVAAFRWIDSNSELKVEQKESYSYSVNRIRFQNWYYVRSSKDNRLHSNLTNLPSDLRKFLSHNGQKLVSLDIKSSQPFMLAGVFNLLISNVDKLEEIKVRLGSKDVKDKLDTVMNSISLEPKAITDLKAYINLICNYDIYNYIAANLDPNFIKTIESKTKKGEYTDMVYKPSKDYMVETDFDDLRAYCKVLVLEYMYCSTESTRRRLKEIKRIYPDVVNRFIYLFKYCKELDVPKSGKKKRTKRQKAIIEKSKKLFAKFLQQLEALIVLDTIAKELSVTYPNMFMATIHDSITVPEKFETEVKGFLQKILYEIFGIKAEVKSENW
jgi:hypothetical protein